MAMNMSSGDGDESGVGFSDINVTPLVDVMLVLLVIFMITAPLINPNGIGVELPKAVAGQIKENPETLWITINKDGKVYIDERALTKEEFETKFQAIIKARAPKDVYIRADEKVAYGLVATTMAEIQAAGVTRIGMVTEPKGAAR